MRPLLVLAAVLASAATARADDVLPPLETGITGYFDSRLTAQHPVWDGLLPTTGVPVVANTTEFNTQLKLRWGDRARVVADLSFFEQAGGLYFGHDADGKRTTLDPYDNPNLRPVAVASELYAGWAFNEHLHLVLGKKRIVWGPGFAVNPTDLLNPPKDPTDPTYQRAGSWLGMLELPYDRFTVSLVGAAKVLRQYGGLPSALLYYPDYDSYEKTAWGAPESRDQQPHFAAAARLYALVADTDVNVLYTFTNLYNDAFDHKNRLGLTLSHAIGAWELHGEVLGQLGNQRIFVKGGCVESTAKLVQCAATDPASIASRSRIDDHTPVVKALAGARYMFEDNALLQLEYYFNGEGYSADEFRSYVTAVARAQELIAAHPALATKVPGLLGQAAPDPGSPQKFTFEPQRRHYAFVTYQKPQIHDDFTFSVVLLLNLQDLSGQLAPSLSWSVREWASLTAGLFAPIPGVGSLGVDVDGKQYTEYGLAPSDWRGYVSARLFY